jgi:hypothetical protein
VKFASPLRAAVHWKKMSNPWLVPIWMVPLHVPVRSSVVVGEGLVGEGLLSDPPHANAMTSTTMANADR